MRNRFVLCVVFGVGAAAVAASDPPAKPTAKPATELPAPHVEEGRPKGASPAQVEALKNEIEKLIHERETAVKSSTEEPGNFAERTKLKSKVLALIDKIEVKKPVLTPMPPAKQAEHGNNTSAALPKFEASPNATDRDKLRSAENLFRSGEIDAAYRILNLVESATLSREERTFAEYLKACSLRKLGKSSEAKVIYRKIADEKDDDFLAECSLSHLQILNTVEELEERLTQLRAGRKKP